MTTMGGNSWSDWHTSNTIREPCPQGCPRDHTVDEAVTLNEKTRECKRAEMDARTRAWMQK
jgi:hypothetical protein